MKLKARLVNTKGHTVGFINGRNQRLSRQQVVAAAKNGRVPGVEVRRGPHGEYVTSQPSTPALYDLPVLEWK